METGLYRRICYFCCSCTAGSLALFALNMNLLNATFEEVSSLLTVRGLPDAVINTLAGKITLGHDE